MISVHFQGKPFSITVIQVYDLTSNAEEAEVEWYLLTFYFYILVPYGEKHNFFWY